MAENIAQVEVKSEKPAKNFMRKRFHDEKREAPEFEERVIEVSRVARTVKGGRRIRFRALVVIGNHKGKIGMGLGKSNDVSEAVKKAVAQAKKKLVTIPIIDGTIPYEVTSKHGSAVVMLKPAASGTSIVAGGSVRAIADLAGITDLLSKMLGSANKVNNIIATFKALSSFNPIYTESIKKMSENAAGKIAAEPVKVEAKAEEKKEEAKEDVKVEKKPKAAVKKAAKKSIKK
jgi:small subunit ribosomal protein S5